MDFPTESSSNDESKMYRGESSEFSYLGSDKQSRDGGRAERQRRGELPFEDQRCSSWRWS